MLFYLDFSHFPLGIEPKNGYNSFHQFHNYMEWTKKELIVRYFPPSKIAQPRNQITYFRRMDGESIFEA